MLPNRPYLLQALYQWIVDSDCTPYILVDAEIDGVDVPHEYVKDGQIVLNLSPSAVADLMMEMDFVSFSARFGGKARSLYVPMAAVIGIYARENGQGMVFEAESYEPPEPPKPSSLESSDKTPRPVKTGGKPSLKVVK